VTTGGGGGRGGGGTSGSGSRPTLATPTAAAAPPTAPPHLPADDDTDGGDPESTGAVAARLAAPSSSARFFASAWRSLHVNLPPEPTVGRVGAEWAAKVACARASNGLLSFFGGGSETGVYAVPCKRRRDHSQLLYPWGLTEHMRLTTGPMRSSSEGLERTFGLGTVCAGTGREAATTVGGGRGAAGGGRDAAETGGLGVSQVPAGTREAAAALPTVVVRTVGPDEGSEETVAAEGRGAEGMAGLGGVGPAALRMAAMSTFPIGV
jgi:hypothetical protein